MQSNNKFAGWVEKLSGGTFGSKWQRRHMRMTFKGLHYYETDKPNEKPKGHKAFTGSSKLITEFDPVAYPKCADNRFKYLAVTVNEKSEIFFLRTASEREHTELLDFLREALEKLRLSMVGQDPNPGRWRARLNSLVAESAKVRAETEAAIAREVKSRHRRDALREELRKEQTENAFLATQGADLEEQEERLRAMLDDARRETEAEAERCKQRVAAAARAREDVIERQGAVRTEIEATKENTARLRAEVQQLQCLLVDKTEERRVAESEHRAVSSRWRRAEERTPAASARRNKRQEGLAYATPSASTAAAAPRTSRQRKSGGGEEVSRQLYRGDDDDDAAAAVAMDASDAEADGDHPTTASTARAPHLG